MIERRPQVLVVAKSMHAYRVPFFDRARDVLTARGVDLEVVHGRPDKELEARGDSCELSWGRRSRDVRITVGHRELLWQPVIRKSLAADLVVLEQASKLLVNPVLIALQQTGRTRVAFWGHGRNRQADHVSALGERMKTTMSRHVHWWFAYTEGCVTDVVASGFPPQRVTVLQNAVDTRDVSRAVQEAGPDVERFRHGLGIPAGVPVVAYIGGLYGAKRLPFLLDAVDGLAARGRPVHLLVIGDGPQRNELAQATKARPEVHLLGALLDRRKGVALAAAELFLSPGLLGLSVLDAFAAGLPVVTVDRPEHSPEIDYVANGVNGLVLPATTTASEFGAGVRALLEDSSRRGAMAAEAVSTASRITVEEMARRFADGVVAALN